MKQVNDPGVLLKWKGKLVEVVGISEGKTIIMRPLKDSPCRACGKGEEYHILEHSPLFQENAETVNTIVS